MGGTYVNDFLNNGRVKRVYIMGDAPHRMLPQDIAKWTVRNKNGEMVPFGPSPAPTGPMVRPSCCATTAARL
jgi:multidrug efflux pump subunit AcrB